MAIGSLEKQVESLKKQVSQIKEKEALTHFQSLDKDNRIKRLLNEIENLKKVIEELKIQNEEEKEAWWQK